MKIKFYLSTFIILFLLLSFIYLNKMSVPLIISNFSLDFESAEIDDNALYTNDQTFHIHNLTSNIWIESELSNVANKYLAVRLENNQSRREVKIIDIPNHSKKYISFSVYFDEEFKIPIDWTLFAQWWQGAPASPPVALEISPNTDTFKFRVLTRHGPYQDAQPIIRFEDSIAKNKWHDFVIEIFIDESKQNNGKLNIWLNNYQILSYTGPLGYPDLKEETNFRLGLYRAPRNKIPAVLYFDNINIGDRTH
ncbi:heparin lyase I family protein [Jeotgalibacillus proteolyticus]|uniref:heparin lyase I family protein n=1 Tax=Jeotgalibacillus proteolyticus TaxID=2082395 RepID=UPI003CF2AB96